MRLWKPSLPRIEDILLTQLWQKCGTISKTQCSVLMFHHVTDEHIDIEACCQCKPKRFRDILAKMLDEGYNFVSLDDVYSFVLKPKGQKLATVTFDDVPANVYFNAYPVLKEFGIPFALFITTKFINREGFLTTEQIIEMSKDSLCTIGAHTITHPMLRRVPDHYKEMSESKRILEELLKKEVKYLAYPYGKHSSISMKVRREAKKIGFKCAFGTIEAPITFFSSLWEYYLPRVIKE